jgi:hypothetical protein
MVPDQTRRRVLQATGVAVAAGLAGCEVRYDPVTEPTGTTGSAGDGPTTPSYGDVGPNADDGNGTGGDGSAGDGTPTATKTVTAGRTFSFEVENTITAENLREAPDVPENATVTVSIIVEENWDDGTENRPFEEQVELGPSGSRRFAEAFTAKRNGPGYIVRTRLEEAPGIENQRSRNLSDARRFTPGGFGEPAGTTFSVTVTSFENDDVIRPTIALRVPAETGENA